MATRTLGGLTTEQKDMIRSMSDNHYTQREIADRVGCSVPTVGRYQKLFNIPASNRYNGGVISQNFREEPKVENKTETVAATKSDEFTPEYVLLDEKICRFAGVESCVEYTMSTMRDYVTITHGEGVLQIEIKYLPDMIRELQDVVKAVEKLKGDKWSI